MRTVSVVDLAAGTQYLLWAHVPATMLCGNTLHHTTSALLQPVNWCKPACCGWQEHYNEQTILHLGDGRRAHWHNSQQDPLGVHVAIDLFKRWQATIY